MEIDLERSRKAHQIEVGSLLEEVKHLKVQLDRARRGSSVPITSEKEVISSISDAAMNTYPISIRIGSCRVGQQQVGAFELVGVDAQGNDVLAGIFRGRIIKDRPGAVSSDVSIFVRSEGKAVAGLTLSDPPPNGGTFLSVAIQSQGTIASCRLMYGEDGSGPGGKGRAIYITT